MYNRSGNGNVTLLVKNTGSRRLAPVPRTFDVVMNGAFRSAVAVTVVSGDDPDSWAPGDVVRVEISAPDLGSGDHRVKVTVNGDEEVFEFNT